MMIYTLIQTALATICMTVSHTDAATVGGTANSVSNGLVGSFGGGGFEGIAEFLRGRILLILTPIALFIIVRAGLRLVTSQEDDKLNKAKTTIGATCVGIMLAYISDRLVMAFYSPGGTWTTGTSTTGANILTTEILGIINWATSFVAIVGVLIIIVAGLKTVSSFGAEDTGILKRSVTGVVTGLLLIVTTGAIKLSIGLAPEVIAVLPTGANPSTGIGRAINIILILLSFTSIIALAVIIYAGMMMVLNWGNEDNFTKGKSLIYRCVAGLAIMLLSGAAVVFIQNLVI